MANYQGLNCIMGEITAMVADARYPHDQHIYDYFTATEKFVRTVVPQLFQDCMEHFREQLVVEFETYLNYYLLAYDDKKKDIVPYRIDRMKAVSLTGEERTGLDVYRKLDLKNYSQRVFSMYRGRRAIVRIQFVPTLLDTMIERFGTKYVSYDKVDDRHYTVEAEVEISDQFYGWLLGFGKRAKMVRPAEEVELFTAYIDKVRSAYD